jgi:hypothetical protein
LFPRLRQIEDPQFGLHVANIHHGNGVHGSQLVNPLDFVGDHIANGRSDRAEQADFAFGRTEIRPKSLGLSRLGSSLPFGQRFLICHGQAD